MESFFLDKDVFVFVFVFVFFFFFFFFLNILFVFCFYTILYICSLVEKKLGIKEKKKHTLTSVDWN
jgi:hypothetical protein